MATHHMTPQETLVRALMSWSCFGSTTKILWLTAVYETEKTTAGIIPLGDNGVDMYQVKHIYKYIIKRLFI